MRHQPTKATHGFDPQWQSNDLSFEAEPREPNRIDSSLLTKMLVGAVVTPVPVVFVAIRVMVEMHGDDASINPWMALAIVACSSAVGALLGAILAFKDRVVRRLAAGQPVVYPLRILFGYGNWSLFAVWFPMIIAAVILSTPLLLLLH